ncbi:MAG TPA: DNA-3-methyladenine glycosylase I [Pseudomonadales bacterium]
MKGLLTEGGVCRCWWCGSDPLYQHYHDHEWGFPVYDDQRLFEKICLEGFQAGLSWITILRKRENFRKAFKDFNIDQLARFNQRSVERLLKDSGIVRHRGKIESTINNARRAKDIQQSFGSLSEFFWQYQPEPSSRPKKIDHNFLQKQSQSAESVALSKELKKRGWSFVGPTTLYAFMQAMGMVNDHIEGCSIREKCRQ